MMAKKNRKYNSVRLIRFLCLFITVCFIQPLYSQDIIPTSLKPDSILDAFSKRISQPIMGYVGDILIWRERQKLVTNNTITASIGSANMYDTYLSPLEYKGYSIHLMYEQMRRTTWFDYKFNKQQIIELEFAKGDSPAKNVTEYWAMLNYRLGGHYSVYNTDKLRLGIGGLWGVNAGVLYNERNGNNPATGRGYTNLELSVTASYKFKWFAVRWQMDTPVAGVLSSYRQSYYEMYLGNTSNMVYFASLHNQRALRNYLTVDIPIQNYTIRVGYLGSWYQTKVHNIQTHHYTNNFVIGFPIEGVKKARPKATNSYWKGY